MEDETSPASEKAQKGHQFLLDDFEGPLDLLLFLIKKNEVSIYDIPIASITVQFLEFIKNSESVELEELTEFYSLAATLLYIKSRMLLPVEIDLSDEIDDPRQDLVEKLIESMSGISSNPFRAWSAVFRRNGSSISTKKSR